MLCMQLKQTGVMLHVGYAQINVFQPTNITALLAPLTPSTAGFTVNSLARKKLATLIRSGEKMEDDRGWGGRAWGQG